MLVKLLLLVALAAVAAARRSPSADYVEKLYKSDPGRASTNIEEDSLLDVPDLIKKYGYPSEIHTLTTSDGYILEAHRIPHGRDNYNTPGKRPVVFIMHGLLSSSADFIVLGPGTALGYVLAEAGYDVWLGNARGNYYSRKHVSLNPDSRFNQNFWTFSWDEIGRIDLPTFIDYILETTGQEKLHYIGHSQGGTTFIVLNSLLPEYNDKFISFQGLAPAAYFDNNEVELFQNLAPLESTIETYAYTMGQGEIFGSRDFVQWFQSSVCSGVFQAAFAAVCEFDALDSLLDRPYFNESMIPLFLAHTPAGASIRQVTHFGQGIRFEGFRRYNYNSWTNLANYGTRTPPDYDVSKVTAPAYLHYGLSDREVNYKDLLNLAADLPNVKGVFRPERDTFNHYDFIWAYDVREQLYDAFVLPAMKEAESQL